MKLDKCLQKLEGAYAPNTLRSYYADAHAFVDWCGERNVEPFPIASKTLCAYIEYLQQNAAYSTIRRRIASLRRLNSMLGFQDQTRTEEVYLAIRRLKRSKCLEQKQAVGIRHSAVQSRHRGDRAYWRTVNSTRGVSRLISAHQRPQALPLGFVDALKAQCDDDMILSDQVDFCENMSVRVTQGPFSGLLGTVLRAAPKERVWVLLDMLGQSAPVTLSTQSLQKVPT